MSSHETFYFRHASYFPSWPTSSIQSLQQTHVHFCCTVQRGCFAAEVRKRALNPSENNQKERESDYRPNCLTVQRVWEIVRFFFTLVEYRIPPI